MEKLTIIVIALSYATVIFSFAPRSCPAPLLSNGQGYCPGYDMLSFAGTPIPAVTGLGLFFCATEMANKTLRKRSRDLKDERRHQRA